MEGEILAFEKAMEMNQDFEKFHSNVLQDLIFLCGYIEWSGLGVGFGFEFRWGFVSESF